MIGLRSDKASVCCGTRSGTGKQLNAVWLLPPRSEHSLLMIYGGPLAPYVVGRIETHSSMCRPRRR
jgi:hypothetical protein